MTKTQSPSCFVVQIDQLNHSKQRDRRFVVLLICFFVSLIAWSRYARVDTVVVANGYIRANTLQSDENDLVNQASSWMEGRVTSIHVFEGEKIEEGDVLLELDVGDISSRIRTQRLEIEGLVSLIKDLEHQQVANEEACHQELGLVDAELTKEQARIHRDELSRKSVIRAAEAAHLRARQAFVRKELVWQQKAGARDEVEAATSELCFAEEQLNQAKLPVTSEELDVLRLRKQHVESDYEYRRLQLVSRISTTNCELRIAREVLSNLKVQETRATILAPCGGTVTQLEVCVGDWIEPGKIPLTIAPDRKIVFVANVDAGDVRELSTNLPAEILLAGFHGSGYGGLTGHVIKISQESSTSRENIGKSNAAYKVWIELENSAIGNKNGQHSIRLGLPGKCEIRTGSKTILQWFLFQIGDSLDYC